MTRKLRPAGPIFAGLSGQWRAEGGETIEFRPYASTMDRKNIEYAVSGTRETLGFLPQVEWSGSVWRYDGLKDAITILYRDNELEIGDVSGSKNRNRKEELVCTLVLEPVKPGGKGIVRCPANVIPTSDCCSNGDSLLIAPIEFELEISGDNISVKSMVARRVGDAMPMRFTRRILSTKEQGRRSSSLQPWHIQQEEGDGVSDSAKQISAAPICVTIPRSSTTTVPDVSVSDEKWWPIDEFGGRMWRVGVVCRAWKTAL